MVSLLNRFQSSNSAGLCGVGAAMGMGTSSNAVTIWPQITQAQHVVEALDGLVFRLQPVLPFEARILVERPLGLVPAEAAVDLPGNQLRMVAQRLGHVFDEPLGGVPVGVIVEADRAARAFVFDQAMFIERQNFRMLFRQPDRRGGGGRAEDNLDVLACP